MDVLAESAHDTETEGQGYFDRQCNPRLPAHFGVIGPNATADETAAYYMYHYKIILCTKDHSHDWGACPFAHEKENARRRDPSKYNYSSCICPNAKKPEGCPNGVACPYAHTLFEYWLHPQRFRTQMCRSGTKCQRNLCFFAHSAAELRTPGSTHEQHIPLPLAVTASAPAPAPAGSAATPASNMMGLSALQVQHLINDSGHMVPNLPLAGEESGSSFGSQASRMLVPPVLNTTMGSGSTNASDTDLAALISSPLMLLPAQAQQQQQMLPSAALLMRLQQQQEMQRRQARFMELQLQLKQQQDNMRAALLQTEIQQQQLAAVSYPLLAGSGAVPLGGMNAGIDMSHITNVSTGLLPTLPSGLRSPAVAAAVSGSTALHMLPVEQLAALSSCQSMLTNLGLSDGNFVSLPSASGFDSSSMVALGSEPLPGNYVQSWL